jgi:hypothetical protein
MPKNLVFGQAEGGYVYQHTSFLICKEIYLYVYCLFNIMRIVLEFMKAAIIYIRL